MKSSILLLVLGLLITRTTFGQDAARGQELYKTCIQCHGENGMGNVAEEAPRIAGQYDWYILLSLNAFKAGERKNEKMLPFISSLSEKDFKDLALYVSQMKK